MSEEELTSKMEFIVDQQAQLDAKLAQLAEIVTRLANFILKRFEDIEEKTAERFRDTDQKIAALVDSQIRLTEAQSQTHENIRQPTTVDRYLGGRRNGD